jgi:hypothetical protein
MFISPEGSVFLARVNTQRATVVYNPDFLVPGALRGPAIDYRLPCSVSLLQIPEGYDDETV